MRPSDRRSPLHLLDFSPRGLSMPLALLVFAGVASGCPSGDGPPAPKDAKEAVKKPVAEPEVKKPPELRPEAKPLDLSGPTPPETSAVLFGIDGALIPIGCFDRAKGKLMGGPDCGKLAPMGETVYLSSEYGKELDTIGDPRNALCEVSGKPRSLSTPILDGGKDYDWGVWPKSAVPNITPIPNETTSETGSTLSEAEATAIKAKIISLKSAAGRGDLRSRQRAEADIDGDGTKELFISAYMADPKDDMRNLYSGLFMARGGDLGKLILLDSSKRGGDTIVLRGTADLNGDGNAELWVGLAFDGGNADRVLSLDGDKATPLGKWSCGA